jgi:hypothetical protein
LALEAFMFELWAVLSGKSPVSQLEMSIFEDDNNNTDQDGAKNRT